MPTPHRIIRLLQTAPFFGGLSEAACARLAGVCRTRELSRRETLFHEGMRGESVFLLAGGAVTLEKTTADGTVVVVKTVRPGEIFAEVILFEENRYPVSARALQDSEVLAIPRSGLLQLLADPGFRDEFIVMLMRKQRYLAERVRYLTAYDVEERFLRFLMEHHGHATRLRPGLSKKDIAAAIGATPETFSRLLQRLRKSDKLTWDNDTIVLNAPAEDLLQG